MATNKELSNYLKGMLSQGKVQMKIMNTTTGSRNQWEIIGMALLPRLQGNLVLSGGNRLEMCRRKMVMKKAKVGIRLSLPEIKRINHRCTIECTQVVVLAALLQRSTHRLGNSLSARVAPLRINRAPKSHLNIRLRANQAIKGYPSHNSPPLKAKSMTQS